MGIIGGRGRHQQRAALHDVVADERHQHGVLDSVIERVAVADTFEREPGNPRDKLGQAGFGRRKAAARCDVKNDPSASAESSGTVIIVHPPPLRVILW